MTVQLSTVQQKQRWDATSMRVASIDCQQGMLIPNTREIKSLQLQDIQWIVVIEKEVHPCFSSLLILTPKATFRTLATSKYWLISLAGKGLILTVRSTYAPFPHSPTTNILQAKGYPDIQTRQFLHLLSISAPTVPIFALVDFDPDGLGIMSTYKYGSMALAHQSQNLAVPSIHWLGVRSSDIIQASIDKTGLLKLCARDRRIGRLMLEKDIFGEDEREQEWRRELQLMLMLNVKAEIQILNSGIGLQSWLDAKLSPSMPELL